MQECRTCSQRKANCCCRRSGTNPILSPRIGISAPMNSFRSGKGSTGLVRPGALLWRVAVAFNILNGVSTLCEYRNQGAKRGEVVGRWGFMGIQSSVVTKSGGNSVLGHFSKQCYNAQRNFLRKTRPCVNFALVYSVLDSNTIHRTRILTKGTIKSDLL
jgi:hypothetical protein